MFISFILIFLGLLVSPALSWRNGLRSLMILLLSLFFFMVNGVYFLSNRFTGDGIDEAAVFQLKSGLSGVGFSDYYFEISLLIVVVLIIAFFSFFKYPSIRNKDIRPYWCFWGLVQLFIVFLTPWKSYSFLLDNQDYSNSASLVLDEKYIDASAHYIIPDIKNSVQTPNLIVVYLESIERSYYDPAFSPKLLDDTRNYESQSLSFTNMRSGYGSGFTIGGLVTSQCGVPLVTTGAGNSMNGIGSFYPKAACLTDVLDLLGYQVRYVNGGSLSFAGKREFFKSHNVDQVDGKEYFKSQYPEVKRSSWGYHDDLLFKDSIEYVKSLDGSLSPNALILLTMDSHHPNGLMSEWCSKNSEEIDGTDLEKTIYCADNLLNDFIREVRQTEFGRSAMVVVTTDHFAMNTASTIEKLEQVDQRANFFYIDYPASSKSFIGRKGDTMDIVATIADVLGWTDRWGFGRSLLRPQYDDERAYMLKNIRSWRDFILTLWDFPKLEGKIEFSAKPFSLKFNGFESTRPTLITIDTGKNTNVLFGGNGSNTDQASPLSNIFEDYPVSVIKGSEYFLAYDSCVELKGIAGKHFSEVITKKSIGDTLCYGYGSYPVQMIIKPIISDIVIDSETVFLNLSELRVADSND